jgi:hypothetical protein
VPTSIGGHGGPPYGPKHLKFHTSGAAGRERPVKSNEKLMNVEHRTFNIEHRIMYSVYFKKTERSDIHHSSIDIRHSLKFHTSDKDPRAPRDSKTPDPATIYGKKNED